MKNLAKDLKDKSFKPFYLLYGDENYLLNYYKKEFKNCFKDDTNMNTVIYDKDNYSDKALMENLRKLPFFAEKKLIILENVKIENDAIYSEMENNKNINTVLYIYNKGEKIDKRIKLYNFFKQNGYVCELNIQSDDILAKFIKNKLDKENKIIASKDIAYLIMKAGHKLDNLMSEIEKLISYVGSRDSISKDDIDKVVHESLDDRVFYMIKCINNNDINKAYEIYADLMMLDTSSSKSSKESIIGLLRYNYNLILSVKSLKKRGSSIADIKSALSLQDFQLRDINEVEKNHDEEYFIDKIYKLCEYNKKMRDDNIDKNAVIEMLISK